MRSIKALTAIALVLAGGWLSWRLSAPGHLAQALPSASISITQPDGVNDVVGEGDDFASTVLGDPWDMSQATDILPLDDIPNAAFGGGVFSYNLPTGVFGVPLLVAAGSQIDAGKIGAIFPIDTDRYRWLSFRLKQPMGSSVQIRWHFARTFTPYAVTQNIPVTTSGWQAYVIDLETFPKGVGDGATDWIGQVLGLYIVSLAPDGSQVSIDWARLTANNPAGNSLTLAWSGLRPAPAAVDFYLDADTTGCDGVHIHTETNASANGSFSWGNAAGDQAAPSNVAPGAYYVCAKVGAEIAGYSPGRLTINHAPIFHFTQPSFTSGDDYAAQAGNAWDMSDAADFPSIQNGAGALQGGNLVVTVPADQGDIQVYLRMPNGVPVDRSRHYYLTYRLKVDYPYSYYTDKGQFSRIYWGRAPHTEAESQLIYVFPDWQTYTLDLRAISRNFGPQWLAADWTLLRLDPIANNTGQSVTLHIDDVKLTGDERADFFADVRWQLTDPDSTFTTLSLYYDTDRSGLNGTLFATLPLTNGQQSVTMLSPAGGAGVTLNSTVEMSPTMFLPVVNRNWHQPCTGSCYTWDTRAVPAGAYYLYACLNDGYNQVCRYTESPLIISHP